MDPPLTPIRRNESAGTHIPVVEVEVRDRIASGCLRGTTYIRTPYFLADPATPTLPVAGPVVTRGHNLKLHKFRASYDLRKYYFTNRVVNI